MLPPVTRRCGPKAQRVPVRAVISRAMAAKRSMPHATARTETSAGGGQLRQPLALAAQERTKTKLIVQLRQCRHVRHPAPEPGGRDVEPQIAGDARELPREVHRLAMLGEARTQGSRAAQLQACDACQISVQLIERAERLHEGSGGAVPDTGHAGDVVHLL